MENQRITIDLAFSNFSRSITPSSDDPNIADIENRRTFNWTPKSPAHSKASSPSWMRAVKARKPPTPKRVKSNSTLPKERSPGTKLDKRNSLSFNPTEDDLASYELEGLIPKTSVVSITDIGLKSENSNGPLTEHDAQNHKNLESVPSDSRSPQYSSSRVPSLQTSCSFTTLPREPTPCKPHSNGRSSGRKRKLNISPRTHQPVAVSDAVPDVDLNRAKSMPQPVVNQKTSPKPKSSTNSRRHTFQKASTSPDLSTYSQNLKSVSSSPRCLNANRPCTPQLSCHSLPLTPKRRTSKGTSDGHFSAPVKSRKRQVSFAMEPTFNTLTQWYYVDSTPSRGTYKKIRRRSHTITNSQFRDCNSSESDPLHLQSSECGECQRDLKRHGKMSKSGHLRHKSHGSSNGSFNGKSNHKFKNGHVKGRRRSMGSLNVPVRKKMRLTLAKQLSLDMPVFCSQPPSFVKAKRRRHSISKSKKRKYQAQNEYSCAAFLCTVL